MRSMSRSWRGAILMTGICWIVGCRDADLMGPHRVPDGRSAPLLEGTQSVSPQVSAGYGHTCALKADGTVVCWGLDNFGQATVPAGLASVTQVSAGGDHTCALKTDGTVACWGNNFAGQATVPAGLASVTQVTAGEAHNCARKTDGAVVCWGFDGDGQATVPAGLTPVTQVSAGHDHTCALKADGTVACWGTSGPTDLGQATVPAGLTSVTQVTAGRYHSCALKADGTVVCWGSNILGETSVPAGLASVTQVDAGEAHTCGLKTDGTVVCWGAGASGQTTVPAGLASVTQVSAGGLHTCALKTDGTLVCWGNNGSGQATVPTGLNLIGRLGVSVTIAPFRLPPPKPLVYNQTTPQLSEPVVIALLSSASFDAVPVDPTHVTLGDGVRTGIAVARINNVPLSSVGDVDQDGRVDRLFVFRTQALVLGGYLSTTLAAAQTLVLLGDHPDGRRFRGQDQVVVKVITPESD